jgi:protein AATF/BFR2
MSKKTKKNTSTQEPKNMKKANLFNEIFGDEQPDDYDPEQVDIIEDTSRRVRFVDEDVSHKPSKAAKSSMILRTQSDLDDSLSKGAYSGQSVRRNDLFKNSTTFDDDDDNDFEALQTDEYVKELRAAKKQFDYEQEGFEAQEGSDSDSDDEGAKRLQSHLSRLTEEGNDLILKGVQNNRADQKKKAQAVFNQKLLYDQLLKTRILVQNPLTICNQLPQNELFMDYLNEAGDKAQQACVESRSMIFDLLCDSLSLQNELFSRHKECKNDKNKIINGDSLEQIRAKRRKLNTEDEVQGSSDDEEQEKDLVDEIWDVIQDSYDYYSKYREESLEKWNRRTRLQSAASTKQFKTLNMDLMTQVNNAKKEKRITQRTHVKRFPEKILGKRSREEDTEEEKEIIDEELFDDKDFYQTLLRDLIQDVGTAFEKKDSTTSMSAALQRATKKKQKEDALRFSRKGKAIEYKVHEKLVNFMAPAESEIPKSAETLFLNLFGGGTVVIEEEDEPAAEDDENTMEDDDSEDNAAGSFDDDLSSFMK